MKRKIIYGTLIVISLLSVFFGFYQKARADKFEMLYNESYKQILMKEEMKKRLDDRIQSIQKQKEIEDNKLKKK